MRTISSQQLENLILSLSKDEVVTPVPKLGSTQADDQGLS
jgi:hypothetical protein